LKTTRSVAIYQSLADHRIGRRIGPIYQSAHTARPIFATLLVCASLILAFCNAPAKPEAPKQTAIHSTKKLKDSLRIYNPQTGNFEETPAFGPRSNK
jgi:hypothetical protein